MARMIPPYVDGSNLNRGERKVFEVFKDQTPQDWIVLHSLNIPETETARPTEIDFLVLAPGLGIFCLEVKGGSITRKDGQWVITDDHGRTYEQDISPLMQARNCMYSLREVITKRLGSSSRYTRLIFSYGAIFPDCKFDIRDAETDQWRVFDQRHKDSSIHDYIKVLSGQSALLYHKYKWFDQKQAYPTSSDISVLKNILKGDFEKIKIIGSKVDDIEQVIAKYTVEQYECLDGLEENPRCLFKGPAGTGKTMLAIEAAKRSFQSKNMTLLTCYNKLLASWLEKQVNTHAHKNIKVIAFLDLLEEIAKEYIPQSVQKDHQYYIKDLPFYALEALDAKPLKLFDKIIIDEGQDILRHEYFDVIDTLLKDGISQGQWDIFCDFEKQNIFNEDTDCLEVMEKLRSKSSFTTYNLKTNCRNTKEIAEEIFKVVGFTGPSILKEELSGIPVTYRYYRERGDAISLLEKEISNLKINRVEPGDITILSPRVLDKSSIKGLEKKHGLINLSKEFERFFYRDTYTYSTVHKFKGMENAYIIIVDLEELDQMQDHEDYYKSLLYIGMSRAKAGLIMLVNEKAKKFLNLD
jgi:hypothetical protein